MAVVGRRVKLRKLVWPSLADPTDMPSSSLGDVSPGRIWEMTQPHPIT